MTAPAPAAPVADAIVDRVRTAIDARTPLRVVGAGRWLDAGRPVRADAQLSLAEATGVLDYVPGDLTLTAYAGTTLSEVQRLTSAERQWVALDPHGGDDVTLGATIATASAGPLAHAFGTPRDQTLGLTLVSGRGEVVRAGGRVVKNVAGFDLTRLAIGSWGTLGAITELTLRLRALPDVDRTLAMPLPTTEAGLGALLARVRTAAVAPMAAELVSAPLARAIGVADEAVILVRVGGNEAAVRAQAEVLASLGGIAEAPVAVWSRLRTAEPPGSATVRCSDLPSHLARTWHRVAAAAATLGDPMLHATAGRGVVRVILPAGDPVALGQALTRAVSGTTSIAERLPASLWPERGPGPAGDRLSRGIRAAFDPHHLMNPGILGEPA
jgi:FAD/FMN-containing dehydrogenase